MFSIGKIATVVRTEICYRKCAFTGHTKYMHDFLSFATHFEEEVMKEEGDQFLWSRIDWMEWQLSHQKTTKEIYSMFYEI